MYLVRETFIKRGKQLYRKTEMHMSNSHTTLGTPTRCDKIQSYI